MALLLAGSQRGEVLQTGFLGKAGHFILCGLPEFQPAVPVQGGRVGHVPQEAAPFQADALDVSGT